LLYANTARNPCVAELDVTEASTYTTSYPQQAGNPAKSLSSKTPSLQLGLGIPLLARIRSGPEKGLTSLQSSQETSASIRLMGKSVVVVLNTG